MNIEQTLADILIELEDIRAALDMANPDAPAKRHLALVTRPHMLLRPYREKHALSCLDFAKRLGIAEVTMRSLENGTREITPERAKDIEDKTGGEITRALLRPDIFGPSPKPDPRRRARAAA